MYRIIVGASLSILWALAYLEVLPSTQLERYVLIILAHIWLASFRSGD